MLEKRMQHGNIIARTDGDTLILEIDLARELGESGSGQSTMIASTQGNQGLNEAFGSVLTDRFPNGLQLGVNLFAPIPETKWSEVTKSKATAAREAKKKTGNGRVSKFA